MILKMLLERNRPHSHRLMFAKEHDEINALTDRTLQKALEGNDAAERMGNFDISALRVQNRIPFFSLA